MTENSKNQITEDKKLKKKSKIKEWVIDIAVVAVVAFLVWHFAGYGVWIKSGSMIPTLKIKDRLIVTRVHNPENLKEGDIVLFKNDEFKDEILIKRLIGLPGDKIDIVEGVVFINGEQLKEDYVKNNEKYTRAFRLSPLAKAIRPSQEWNFIRELPEIELYQLIEVIKRDIYKVAFSDTPDFLKEFSIKKFSKKNDIQH